MPNILNFPTPAEITAMENNFISYDVREEFIKINDRDDTDQLYMALSNNVVKPPT